MLIKKIFLRENLQLICNDYYDSNKREDDALLDIFDKG